jgi:hypothetical protein
MKKISILFLLIAISIPSFAQDDQNFKFGDSFDSIRNHFDATSTSIGKTMPNEVRFIMPEDDKSLISIADVNYMPVYNFLDSKLEKIRYFSADSHNELSDYLKDYEKVKKFLSNKYETIETREFWDDETYKGDPDMIPKAISLGHYNISTTYTNGDITIIHIIKEFGDENKPIYQIIDYRTRKFLKFEKKNPPSGKDVLRRKK